jgi:hypothetical protein
MAGGKEGISTILRHDRAGSIDYLFDYFSSEITIPKIK